MIGILQRASAFAALIFVVTVSAGLHFPYTTNSISLAAGSKIFSERCEGCHGISPQRQGIGPNLATIGIDSKTRVAAMSGEQYLMESLLEPDKRIAAEGKMPSGLVDSLDRYQLLSLLAYLQSLGSEPNFKHLLRLSTPMQTITTHQPIESYSIKDIEKGRQLFYGKFNCGGCHSLEASPGESLIAPVLNGIGNLESRDIEDSIRNANARIAERYRQHALITMDGVLVTGQIISESKVEIRMLCKVQSGEFNVQTIKTSEVDHRKSLPNSIMPSWGHNAMSEEECTALVTFLRSMK